MNYLVHISDDAEKDITDIALWYEDLSAGLGRHFLLKLENSIAFLGDNPFLFQRVYKDVRRTLIERFPYKIFYKIEKNIVYIIAVLHVKRGASHLIKRM